MLNRNFSGEDIFIRGIVTPNQFHCFSIHSDNGISNWFNGVPSKRSSETRRR
jgi:hypothetical protein